MDRELGSDVRRRRMLKRVAWALPAVATVFTLWFVVPSWLRPSVARAALLTARVERGRVEASVEGSGLVLPARETVLSSPIDTRVVRQAAEGDVGATVVLVFRAVGRGQAQIVVAETKGETAKAYRAVRYVVAVA